MREKDVDVHLPLSPVKLQVLLSLSDGDKHGYGIKHEVEERTEGKVRLGAGTLYAAIRRLEMEKLLEEVGAPPGTEGDTERWRFYRLTAFGRRVLFAEVRRLEADIRAARAKGLSAGIEGAG